MKLSGPQKSWRTPVSFEIGTRSIAVSMKGAMRSQSGGISPNAKSSGTPSTFHGFASDSKKPINRPPTSSRKYPNEAGSSITGQVLDIPSICSVIR